MSEILRRRLQQALDAQGKAATTASLAAGLGRTFISDFLSHRKESMGSAKLQKIADELKVSAAWLTGETESGGPAGLKPDEKQAEGVPSLALADERHEYARGQWRRDIPLLGTAAGSVAGSVELTGEVIDWLVRAPGLRHVRDAYALYVSGSSMEPRYFAGEVVIANPHRPYRAGDIVIIQVQNHPDAPVEAWIKEFVRKSEEFLVTRQYNEPSEVKFRVETLKSVHRVLTANELLGIS